MNKFKVGSTVKVVNPADEELFGHIGIIRDFVNGAYLVKVDMGCGKDYWIPYESLELVSNPSVIQQVMDVLRIPVNTPIDIYSSKHGSKYLASPYVFDGKNFYNCMSKCFADGAIGKLISGECTFKVKKSFPQKGDNYYCITVDGNIRRNNYDAGTVDITLKLIGNFFQTKEEAESHREEILAKYQEAKNL